MTGKKPAAVLMFLLVILKVVGTAEADCSCTSSSCDCSWQSLTSVPQDLPTTITSLQLGVNRITAISQSDFSRYGSLEYLSFHNNRISIISYQAFYPLSNLIRLYLYANRLTILRPDMFTGLENLKDLNLYHNDISDIQAGTFSPTPQLKNLYLSSNKLTGLRSDMFTGNLEYLDLSYNEISDIPAGTFNPMPRLRTLYLNNNKLTILRSDMFTGLGNMEWLQLNNNDISDIQAGTFNPMPQLRKLYLYNNHIQTIPSNLLTNLLQLTDLRLSDNNITVFPFEDLSNIQRLSYLHLHNNQMTTLPSMAYDLLSSISDVNIDNNPWQCDCRMVDFRQKMNGARPFENQINCSHPDHLSGLKLIDINPEDLFTNCQEPTIVRFEKSKNYILAQGENLHLLCQASGIPTPDITVILPSGLNATVESDGKVTVDVNGTITIKDVTAADAGLYACIATSPVGYTNAILVVNIHVVYEEPTIVGFLSSEDNPLVEGETLRLVCEASGIPTPDITVILPSGLNATVESVGKVTVDLNGTITITNVTAADAGLYVCVATSPVGSKLSTLYIEVFYKEPTIVSFKRSGNGILAQGESLHLVCEASGIPTPDITVILPSGVNATVESVGRVTMDVNGNIVIRNISAADSGLYGCIVANPAGFAFANLSINVIYEEPTIVRFERGDKNILVGGELLCEASGIPTPKITVILPSGQNATSDSDVTLWVNGSTVVTVTTVDAGLYICTASNTVGSKFATFYIDVESKVTTVATATSSLAITGTSYKPETNNYHAHDPSFSLPVLLAAVCGSVAGTLIIGGIILAIWCKRINQSAPKGPDFSVVFNNTNATTTVIANGQDLTSEAQPVSLSSNVRNPQLVPRPASSQFEPYEDVQPPPRGAVQIQTARGLPLDARKPKTRKRPASSQSQAYEDVEPPPTGAVSSQTARGQALRSPNRTDNEPPPVPPPRTASATGYENIPEHTYQPLAVTRNQPDNGQDTSHHYQSLIRT
ncbi:uncharacterized protein LOC144903538 [Branchiostoma floridae x Branchiostoma belcheri]